MFELEGRTALVTGSGQGMGLGIARALGQQGAKLWINDLFQEQADQACQTLRQEGLDATPA